MHKVIVERPRHGRSWARTRPRPRPPFEDSPRRESIKARHTRRKWFSDLLGPLRRWLQSQVGRSWNEVYSEACAVIKPDSVVRAHIRTHLLEFVVRETFMRNGEVWCIQTMFWSGSGETPVRELSNRHFPFYVHPVTGILCAKPPHPRKRDQWQRYALELAKVRRWIDPQTLLVQWRGLWFECTMRPVPREPVRDELWLARVSVSHASEAYGRAMYCARKRQLSRDELRAHGLTNSLYGELPCLVQLLGDNFCKRLEGANGTLSAVGFDAASACLESGCGRTIQRAEGSGLF